MNIHFKKMLCFILTLVICISSTSFAFAAEQKDSIVMEQISIDPLDNKEAEAIISEYHLQRQTAQTIRNIMNNHKNRIANISSITVSIPETKARGTRTYKGYGNKTYYEEIVTVENNTNFQEVSEDIWSDYATSRVEGIMEYVSNRILNSASLGIWSIANIFVPSSVPANVTVRHQASLIETKDIKHTYVVEDG